ncbi:MAG: type II toxin-antitoxin system death-on-curing family toxin [Candidatus Nanopelagicales bacterium]|nr:type II toxin-antitoxin system death-on-curing family toxin [Candidatus Nanopelagicales bacterium]
MAELGVDLSPQAKTLPKGALARLHHPRAKAGASVELMPLASGRVDAGQALIAAAPLKWVTIGRVREVVFLSAEQANGIHWALVDDFDVGADPIQPAGLRDANLLESAMLRATAGVGSEAKYPSVEMAGAAMAHSLIHNHPFHNGNKRTALVCLLVMLDENGMTLTCTQDDLFRFTLRVAGHRLLDAKYSYDQQADREVLAMAVWIHQNGRSIRKGERPMKWHELRGVLNSFGCSFEAARVGNRMNIYREIQTRTRWLGPPKTKRLKHQTWYGGEGSEVEMNSLNDIRRELCLDDDHGIDSEIFYGSGKKQLDEFIVEYRKTLRRLARL